MIDLLLRIDESLVPGNECNSEELLRESSEEIWLGRHMIETLEGKVEDLGWDVEDLEFDLRAQEEKFRKEIEDLKRKLNSKEVLLKRISDLLDDDT